MSNQIEYAYPLAFVFAKESLDHILTLLFKKTIFFEQMSLTNIIIEAIQNHTLKEVLEASLYINSSENDLGEIRTQRKNASGN